MGNKREVSKNKTNESTFVSDVISNYAKLTKVSDEALKAFHRKPYYMMDRETNND